VTPTVPPIDDAGQRVEPQRNGSGERPAGPPGYAELRAKSNFSFLRGASTPEELVVEARSRGLAAIGIADLETLAGVVQAHVAAKAAGIRLLVGAEVRPSNGPALVLYPVDRPAYGRLSRLITLGRRRAPKGSCDLSLEDVFAHAAGLLAIAIPPRVLDSEGDVALARVREAFGDRAYLALERHHGADDPERVAETAVLGLRHGLPLVAVNDVHYHVAARSRLQDVLVCIREGVVIDEAGAHLFSNAERHLKGAAEMLALFPRHQDTVARSIEVAARVQFSLDDLRYEYPEEVVPRGVAPIDHLGALVREGAARRYPEGVPPRVESLIAHEMAIIGELRYEPFFLTVHDIVAYARSREILCQGRGSAANSAVCFCLGITAVDPVHSDLLFERFVSRERNEPPDIDVDFEHERREEVIQYVYEKYGRDRAGIVAEVIRYRGRSAVRDVGKALGLSLDQVERLAVEFHWSSDLSDMEGAAQRAGLDPTERRLRLVFELAQAIQDFPRHLSQHVGGFVITRGPLCELVPIENAAMEGRTVIEWDKDDIDALGILKVDCLSLGALTALRKCFQMIEAVHGRRLELATVPAEDPETYEMISRADTIGVFQIESRAQIAMLPRLRPRTFYDLVIQIALIRPGPIQGGMVHPYLRRRSGDEEVSYPSEALRDVLHKTLGVPLFQEQAMRLAIVAAGFTPGEADQLRRAMGAWRKTGVMEGMRAKLIQGMRANGYSGELAEQIFEQLKGFGEYGFPESHATSFAHLAYVAAWQKRHYPAAFFASILNSLPMGFYAPAQLVRDAQERGVSVRRVDVLESDWDCTVEVDDECTRSAPALRLGLRLVSSLGEAAGRSIVLARRAGRPFRSVAEAARRTRLPAEPFARLAAANAFRSMGLSAREALWAVETIGGDADLPLFADLEVEEPPARLPAMTDAERVADDYRTVGLSLERHPVTFFREDLRRRGVVEANRLATLENGAQVIVGGLVTVRQRPSTAKGIIFMTIEDETGIANAVIRPSVYERNRAACFGAIFIVVTGRLERKGEVIHVLARSLLALRGQMGQSTSEPSLPSYSRDFH